MLVSKSLEYPFAVLAGAFWGAGFRSSNKLSSDDSFDDLRHGDVHVCFKFSVLHFSPEKCHVASESSISVSMDYCYIVLKVGNSTETTWLFGPSHLAINGK